MLLSVDVALLIDWLLNLVDSRALGTPLYLWWGDFLSMFLGVGDIVVSSSIAGGG